MSHPPESGECAGHGSGGDSDGRGPEKQNRELGSVLLNFTNTFFNEKQKN